MASVRGARSLPEGRSLAPRERERDEGPGARSRPPCRAARRRRSRVPSKRKRRLARQRREQRGLAGAQGGPDAGRRRLVRGSRGELRGPRVRRQGRDLAAAADGLQPDKAEKRHKRESDREAAMAHLPNHLTEHRRRRRGRRSARGLPPTGSSANRRGRVLRQCVRRAGGPDPATERRARPPKGPRP